MTEKNNLRAGQAGSESGNVIWFLLLAIALTAALTLAITRSSGTSEQSGGREQGSIGGSAVLNTAQGLSQAVSRVMQSGCSENDLSFASPLNSGYANPAAPASGACSIFSAAGGGESYGKPSASMLDAAQTAKPAYGQWVFSGANCARFGVDACNDADSSDDMLIAILPWVSAAACADIDRLLGIAGAIPQDAGTMNFADPFTGSYGSGGGSTLGDPADARLAGKRAACIRGNHATPGNGDISGGYFFYYVLYQRG